MPKYTGAAILADDGGIESFNFDYVFLGEGHRPCPMLNRKTGEIEMITGTGKSGAVYHDFVDEWKEIDGNRIHITRNVSIVNMDYSMTEFKSYKQLRMQVENWLDEHNHSDYNKKW